MSTPTPPLSSTSASRPANCPHCGRAIPANAALGACPHCLLAAGLASEPAAPANAAPPPTPAELAPEFPQLDILELLGRGGMGAVYKARQKSLDRFVALKLLRSGLDADPSFADRFTREARALAQLNHSGIVTLYEFGRTESGRFFILMEFVDGLNLRQLLAAGRLSPREALAIVPPLCDALQYAHDRGLIHRDIKPENILIDRLGRVKIADFGLAKLTATSAGRDGSPSSPSESPASSDHSAGASPSHTDHSSSVTGHSDHSETAIGIVFGTPQYMAPEQRERPYAVDHRADIYALGVVLYQMLTGELPDSKQLQPPSRRVQLDIRLDEIVLRALETNPALRYSAANDFKTQLETVASSSPPPPGAPTSPSAASSNPVNPVNPVQKISASPPFRLSAIFSRPRLKFWLLRVAPSTLLITLALRIFVIAPYRIEGSSVEPEIPAGSLAFVYKLDRHFSPGDIVAYHHTESLTYVARVAQPGPVHGQLLISRRDQPPISIPASSVIGGVVFNTRNSPLHPAHPTSQATSRAVVLMSIAALATGIWLILGRSSTGSPQRILRFIAAAFFLLYALHLLWIFSTADELPALVASHFGMNGRADGFLGKNAYLIFIAVFPLGLGLFFQATALLTRRLPAQFINIPHRAVWLTPERRPEFIAILQSWLAALACGLVIFSAQLHTLTLLANRLSPPRLPDIALFTLLGFPTVLLVWCVGFLLRLAEPQAAEKSHARRPLIIAIVSASLLGFFAAPAIISWAKHEEPAAAPVEKSTPASLSAERAPSTESSIIPRAETWLHLIDAGHYGDSWQTASSNFQRSITEARWTEMLTSARTPMGAVISRQPGEPQRFEQLPDTPGGPHLILAFTTRFEHAGPSIETVRFTRETDGHWRASSYFVKPQISPASPSVASQAGDWLHLIDKSDYVASWAAASSHFKKAVSESQWETAMQSVRAPLGAVLERTLRSSQQLEKIPNAPGGPHTILQFTTRFENKPDATETVTFTRDENGEWRASGYLIK